MKNLILGENLNTIKKKIKKRKLSEKEIKNLKDFLKREEKYFLDFLEKECNYLYNLKTEH